MKIAITGKGGTGKTTLSSILARALSDAGRPVIAVDADPDANLASALGLPSDQWPEPISQMKELIQERTEQRPAREHHDSDQADPAATHALFPISPRGSPRE